MEYVRRQIRSRPGLSREAANASLEKHPQFVPGTHVASLEAEGTHWVATLFVPKTAAPPPFPPKKDDAAAGIPPEDGEPKDAEESEGGKPPFAEDENAEKPLGDKEGPDKGPEAGLQHAVDSLTHLVQQIAEAVGVVPNPEDSPIPGDDLGAPPPPGPPHGPPGGGPEGKIPPKKPLRPGEAPPGTTPIGAPAFASTNGNGRAENPFPGFIGKVATFTVDSPPTGASIREAADELRNKCAPFGYQLKQIREGKNDQGQRVIYALVSAR